MFRETGPAQIDVKHDYSTAGVLTALLYNFDFDDSADKKYRPLKAKHIEFLTKKVLPLLVSNRGNIWMQGSASRIGTNQWNMELSQTRVGRVVDFLLRQGIDTEQIQQNAVGEELAGKHSEDDPRDRSVFIWVYPQIEAPPKPPAPLPHKVPPIPKIGTHFKIAYLKSLSFTQSVNAAKLLRKVKLSGSVAADVIDFIIWNERSGLACYYIYVGFGLGAGLSITPFASATEHGDWTSFETEKPIGCWQFDGFARFTTAGVAKWSVNWVYFSTPAGVDNLDPLRIETGMTWGGGLSSTLGEMTLASKPFPFKGP